MADTKISMPNVVPEAEWRVQRVKLLEEEKAHTREKDRINAARRRLPMVKVDKEYEFDTTDGKKSLRDLFEGKRQLLVYHFMFAPDWEEGCPGCTGYVDALGDLSDLPKRNSTFVVISRAPLDKLQTYKEKHGWEVNWVSAGDGDFNYDFHATLDESRAPIDWNYRTKEEWEAKGMSAERLKGEQPGISVFFNDGENIYFTYSSHARGVENATDSYALLDLTPYGRQEDFEDSPEGWPQSPTYG